jgi:hypothetical protein
MIKLLFNLNQDEYDYIYYKLISEANFNPEHLDNITNSDLLKYYDLLQKEQKAKAGKFSF